jgi:hypothetical protein
MRCLIRLLIHPGCLAILAAVCCGTATPQETAGPGPAAPNVVLRFHNGSVVQPAVLLEAVEIETKLGKISIPANEVRRIDLGFRVSEEDGKKLEKALADLGSDKYQAREAATKTLMTLGRIAYPYVVERTKGADLETAKRLEVILKDIRARVPTDKLVTRRTDVIRTSDSTLTGKITNASLRVRCDLFGEVKVDPAQLRELRASVPGELVVADVEANKYGNRNNWLETEFEVMSGTKLEITATGEINLDPGNQLNNQFTRNVRPDGVRNLVSGEQGYWPGQLLGRIGSDGPTFVIGSRFIGNTDREGKLFVRIVTIEHANNIKADGKFQVRVSSE